LDFDCEIGKDTWNLFLEQAGFLAGVSSIFADLSFQYDK